MVDLVGVDFVRNVHEGIRRGTCEDPEAHGHDPRDRDVGVNADETDDTTNADQNKSFFGSARLSDPQEIAQRLPSVVERRGKSDIELGCLNSVRLNWKKWAGVRNLILALKGGANTTLGRI